MALMQWNSTFSINVKKFDDQHKRLVELINQLYDAMKSGEGFTMLESVLHSVINYTATHFADEEKMMAAHGYPDLAKHKAIHQDLVKRVLELQQKLKSGSPAVTMEVLNFLKDWLVKHIQGEDKLYGTHFNSKGVF